MNFDKSYFFLSTLDLHERVEIRLRNGINLFHRYFILFKNYTVHLHRNRLVKGIFNSWTGKYIRSTPFRSEMIEILVIKIFVLA